MDKVLGLEKRRIRANGYRISLNFLPHKSFELNLHNPSLLAFMFFFTLAYSTHFVTFNWNSFVTSPEAEVNELIWQGCLQKSYQADYFIFMLAKVTLITFPQSSECL
jgi:hypothetical protein